MIGSDGMGTKTSEDDKSQTANVSAHEENATKRYILRLKAEYGGYARPADEARRIVDDSMGNAGALTDLLHKTREDSRS
jgi:hypothetical protein